MSQLLQQHRHVLERSASIVAQVRPDQLDLPTPCAGWALRDLLAHMIGQNYGFAAAAVGPGPDADAFAPRPIGADPAGQYAESVQRVLDAFASPGLLGRGMFLAEVRGGMTIPAPIAIGFHLVDYVAHGWDVARAIDVPVTFDEDALATALQVAEDVPDEAKSIADGTPFRPSVPTAGPGTLARIVALLGRSPSWPDAG